MGITRTYLLSNVDKFDEQLELHSSDDEFGKSWYSVPYGGIGLFDVNELVSGNDDIWTWTK